MGVDSYNIYHFNLQPPFVLKDTALSRFPFTRTILMYQGGLILFLFYHFLFSLASSCTCCYKVVTHLSTNQVYRNLSDSLFWETHVDLYVSHDTCFLGQIF